MLVFEELKQRLTAHYSEMVDLKDAIAYDSTKMEIDKLEYKTAENSFGMTLKNRRRFFRSLVH